MSSDISQCVLEEELTALDGDDRVVEPGGQSESLELVATTDGREWLSKRYSAPISTDDPANARLRRLVSWRRELSDPDRAFLDARAAWPRAVICSEDDAGSVLGVLVPAAAPEFWCSCTDADEESPRHLDELFRDVLTARRHRQEYFNTPDKLARLGHLHELMAFLHRRGVVLGDVNAFNVLIAGPASPPAVYLVDCDSVHLDGIGAFPLAQVETMVPDPVPPRWPADDVTVETDVAKLALLIVRSLQESAAAYDFHDGENVWLPDRHRRRLRAVLRLLDLGADAQALNSVTAGWKGCSDGTGTYRIRDSDKLVAPWTGPPSVDLDGWGPADDVKQGTANGTVTAGSNGSATSSPPVEPHRRRGRWWVVAAVSAALILFTAFLLLDSRPWEHDPTAVPALGTSDLLAGATLVAPSWTPDSEDGSGRTTTFSIDNVWDGDGTTCWRMAGDGSGSTIEIQFPEPRTVTSVGLVNGYAKVDDSTQADRYEQERRITQVTWSAAGLSHVQTLVDGDRSLQTMEIAPVVTDTLALTIDSTVPGDLAGYDYTAISELSVLGALDATTD